MPHDDTSRARISARGANWIAEFETGGASYYRRFLQAPTYPGGASGVTIGVGYDIGYNTAKQVLADWAGRIPAEALTRLAAVAGLKGDKAKAAVAKVRDIAVPWDAALAVFLERTVPRFGAMTAKAFPGLELLPVPAQEALLSLVFNRGASLSGDSRREMAGIADVCARLKRGEIDQGAALVAIAQLIEAMKRLWRGKGLDGLLKRRDAEASRVRQAVHLQGEWIAAGEKFRAMA